MNDIIHEEKHEATLKFPTNREMNKALTLLERSGIIFDIKCIADWKYDKFKITED